MTSRRAPRLAAAGSLAALAALIGASPSTAGRLCGSGSDKRPPTDAARSTATAVTATGLTGPGCYTLGLDVALPSDAGNVTIADVWVEGTGIAVKTIPPNGSLVIKESRVSPTRTQTAVLMFTAVSFKPTTGDQGRLLLSSTVLDVNGDDWSPTDVWRIAAFLCDAEGGSLVDVQMSGGAVLVSFASPPEPVEGFHVSHSVRLLAENVPISVNVSSVAEHPATATAVFAWQGGDAGVHCHLDHVNIDVACIGNGCWAAGAATISGHGIHFRVTDTTIQASSWKTAHGISLTEQPFEMDRSVVTVNAVKSIGIRSEGALLISQSVLTASGSTTATPVDAYGEHVIVHRTVLSGAPGAAPLRFDSSLRRLELIDVDVATPDTATGRCAVANWGDADDAGAPQMRVRGVRCGGPRAPVGEADVVAGLSGATGEAPGECGGGYVVGFVPTVSLDPALPPFRWGDLGSMCMKSGVNALATAIAPTARVSVLNIVENVTIPKVSLGVLTIVGGVPAGVTVELIGTRLGPLEAGNASAEAVLEVSGPLLGTLSLTGGSALRGAVHIAGDFGPDALLKVDGATVETAENATALDVDGELRGEVWIGASGVTVFQGSISAAPAELAKWRGVQRLSEGGSEVTDELVAFKNSSTTAVASGAKGLRGLTTAAAAGLCAFSAFL